MGCFGYICNYCDDAIRSGEGCTLIHLRHDKEKGRVSGSYNSYGGVEEDNNVNPENLFRGEGSGINSHESICKSEFDFDDSVHGIENLKDFRKYKGRYYSFEQFLFKRVIEDFKTSGYDLENTYFYNYLLQYNLLNSIQIDRGKGLISLYNEKKGTQKDSTKFHRMLLIGFVESLLYKYTKNFMSFDNSYLTLFKQLPKKDIITHSGIVAYHYCCFKKAEKENKLEMKPSKSDPNQSFGPARKKYLYKRG